MWSQIVSSPYKGHIYDMETFYSDSLFLASVTRDATARSKHVEKVVCTHVHVLNKEVHQMPKEEQERF